MPVSAIVSAVAKPIGDMTVAALGLADKNAQRKQEQNLLYFDATRNKTQLNQTADLGQYLFYGFGLLALLLLLVLIFRKKST